MTSLKDTFPDPEKLLSMEPHDLGPHVLNYLNADAKPDVKRAFIAKHLASNYHADFQHDLAHAFEEALGWLFSQCLLGASPYDPELVFLTRKGKKVAEEYKEKSGR